MCGWRDVRHADVAAAMNRGVLSWFVLRELWDATTHGLGKSGEVRVLSARAFKLKRGLESERGDAANYYDEEWFVEDPTVVSDDFYEADAVDYYPLWA